MSNAPPYGEHLLRLGIALFLLGLLTGFAVPALANPRMGLSSHLEGILNGIFLVVLGLLWPRLILLISLSIAMVAVCGLVLWGLRGRSGASSRPLRADGGRREEVPQEDG